MKKAIAEQDYQLQIAQMKDELDAAKTSGERRIEIAKEIAEKVGQTYGTGSRQYAEAEKEVERMERAHQDELTKIAQDGIAARVKISGELVDVRRQQLDLELTEGKITNSQKLDQERELITEQYAIQRQATLDRIALLQEDVKAQTEAKNELLLLDLKYQLELQKNADLQAKNAKAEWNTIQSSVSTALDQMALGVLRGTETMRQAFRKLALDIGQTFLQLGIQTTARWALDESAKTTATALGLNARGDMEAGAAAESIALWAATALKNIMIDAKEAMAGAYKAIVGIPYVGPALAPAAAAAAGAAVGGFGGGIPSAAGGYDIPAGINPIVQTHAREMILPAKYADVIRGLASGAGGGGGDVHHHHYQIQAVDGESVRRLFMNHGAALGEAMRRQSRNFVPTKA